MRIAVQKEVQEEETQATCPQEREKESRAGTYKCHGLISHLPLTVITRWRALSKRLDLYDDFPNCQFTDLSYSSLPAFIGDFYQVCFLEFANLVADIGLA
jgi:hypothetical protein